MPYIMKEQETVHIGVSMPRKLRDEFDKLSKATGRKMAGYLRYLIERELEKAKNQ